MGVIFEIHPMVNAYELHVTGTLIPIEIPIVEIGGAPQMRGSGGCDSGFGQVLLRCLSKYVLWRVQPPIWLGAIEMPIKVLNCTPARTMYSCEYFKPLSSMNLSTQSESHLIRIFNEFLYDANARGRSCT